jgi:protein-S-isoprenylcysteine O-methyltransferase Ste14
MKSNYGSLALLAVVLPFVVMNFWGPPWTIQRIAGLALAIPSFLLLALARVQLGRAFSVQAKASILVTSGLYSRIRNPIYVFGSLSVAGLMLWSNFPWLLLLFVILLPMQVYRSRNEARVLEKEFGPAYLDYKRQTWF